jgi:hypothetical protein
MPAFIYLCDMTTERECLDRMLFGTNNGDNYSNVDVGENLLMPMCWLKAIINETVTEGRSLWPSLLEWG